MLTSEEALARAADAVARAVRAGADAADCVVASSGSTEVSVRLGKVEAVERSENTELGLRLFVGSRSASASTSDFSVTAIDTLVERTLSMARLAPEDAYAGLAASDLLARGPFTDFDSDDGVTIDPEALRERALAAEDAARAVPGVTNSEGAGASHGTGVTGLATSTGFAGVQRGSSHGVSASVLAGEGAGMERDYYYHSVRHLADLDAAAAVGAEAGRRAVARRGPKRLPSGTLPVVFAARVANGLLGHFVGAINGASIARGTSFLLNDLGKPVFAPGVSIVDDPWRARGLRSRAFDGEGLATKPVALIDDGVLMQWIANAAAARQLGIAPTGHASRGVSGAPGTSTSNLHLASGRMTPAELMSDIRHGFYVTELAGMGVNGLTGDYSRGASGFEIIDGRIAGPVSEVTIAGNLRAMFMALVPADDLEFRNATNAPTVRIDGMTLAGA